MSIFYRPTDGVAADIIPLYYDGEYHLFYLKDYRDPQGHGEGTPWWHLVTRDFVTFHDWGEALPRGGAGEQDLYVFTGSALAAGNGFHIYYTGHNPHFRKAGAPEQAVMHATSADLRLWHKRPDHTFFPPPSRYEPHDWRDPFVFWNAEAGEYWMLLAARHNSGPRRHRGLTACMASRDLVHWEERPPFWAPNLYFTHECPDYFAWGDWHYLVFSEFSDAVRTRYRLSRSLHGPWRRPPDDLFDDRAFYAAKSAGDGEQRYLFGWLPTRAGDKDDGRWQWGGNLVVHELVQQPDGTLCVRAPRSVLAPFSRDVPLNPRPRLGAWEFTADSAASAPEGLAMLALGVLPQEGLTELEVTSTQACASLGLFLRADAELERYYLLRLEPTRSRLVFDRRPSVSEHPFTLERPLDIQVGRATRLSLLVEGSCLVAYVDERVALSARLYDFPAGEWGLFVSEGAARFDKIAVQIK